MLTAGFPCPPFSQLTHARWNPGFRCWHHLAGEALVDIAEWVLTSPTPPKVIILENVKGMRLRGKTGASPLDMILRGATARNGTLFRYGLELWAPCHLLNNAASSHCGLLTQRSRALFVLMSSRVHRRSYSQFM